MKPAINPFAYDVDYTEIGQNIVGAARGGWCARADLTACLPPRLRDMAWTDQKELTEKLADLLVGAGVLIKVDHRYTVAGVAS